MTDRKEEIKQLLDEECWKDCWYTCPEYRVSARDSITKRGHKETTQCWMCHRNDELARRIEEIRGMKENWWLKKDCRKCKDYPNCPYVESRLKKPRGCSLYREPQEIPDVQACQTRDITSEVNVGINIDNYADLED